MIKISRPTLLNYFNGRSKIDVYTIERIAEILDVNVCYFFQDECFQSVESLSNFDDDLNYKKNLEHRLISIETRLKKVENI
jgi:transcriptional regulator with XRE-family HTH domain